MPTREIIREGMIGVMNRKLFYSCPEELTDRLLEFLHSNGVVIKVDRELPTDEGNMARQFPEIFDGSLSYNRYTEAKDKYLATVKPIMEDMLEAGYESLIDES